MAENTRTDQAGSINEFSGGFNKPYRAKQETEWCDSPQSGSSGKREPIPKGAIALFDRAPTSKGEGDWQDAMYEGQVRYVHPDVFEPA
ncbi:MAG: hypothetical protein ACR2M1_14075 [Gemmatimonadaceae bacterium]